MQKKLKNLVTNDFFPFIILGISILIIHFLVSIPVSDDIWFSSIPNGPFDWDYYVFRYFNWTSRIIIEFVTIFLLHLPSTIWRISNTIIYVLLGIALSKLFINKKRYLINWVIAFLLLLFPFRDFSDVGWVTTTVNYLWPTAFGLWSVIPLKKIIKGEKISAYEYVLSIIALLFAINHEMICVVLVIIFLVATIYSFKTQKTHWFIFLGLGLSLLGLIFILTCPGNSARLNSELSWFVDFNHISLIEKVEINLSSTMSHFIYEFNVIYLFFVYLIFVIIRRRYDRIFYFIFSSYPLIMVILFGIVLNYIPGFLPNLDKVSSQITKYGLITLENFTQINSYISLVVLYSAFLLSIVLLYLCFDRKIRFISIGIFSLGIITRLTLLLSPTIWASGKRTFFPLSIALIICCVLLFEKLMDLESDQYIKKFLTIIGYVSGVMYLELFMSI